MKPDIEHIVTYIKVVEHKSFTGAAEALNVSKSVISKHVTALEEALNTRLLHRSTRKLTITDAGQAFYEQVRGIPDLVCAGESAIQPFNEVAKGHLKIIVPETFASSLRLEVIPKFLSDYSDVHINITAVPSAEDYIEGDFDILVMGHLAGTPMPDVNLVGVELCKVPLGVYATPEYLKNHGTPKTPADLEQHNCISSLNMDWPFKNEEGYLYRIPVKGNLTTNNDAIAQSAVMQHLGVTYSFPYLYMHELANKKVKAILKDYTDLYVEVFALYHPNPYLPMKTRAFIDVMKAHYQAMQAEILARKDL